MRALYLVLIIVTSCPRGANESELCPIIETAVNNEDFYKLFRLDKKKEVNILDTIYGFDPCQITLEGITVNLTKEVNNKNHNYISVLKYDENEDGEVLISFFENRTNKKLDVFLKRRNDSIFFERSEGGVF